MDFDAAHLSTAHRKWREPLVADAFCCETNQCDPIIELLETCRSIQHLPGRHTRKAVVVADKTDVERSRTDDNSAANVLFQIRADGKARRMQNLNRESLDEAAFLR